MQSFHAEIFQMTAIGGPSRLSRVEVQGPDPGRIETLFYHLRALVVENTVFLLPSWLVVGRYTSCISTTAPLAYNPRKKNELVSLVAWPGVVPYGRNKNLPLETRAKDFFRQVS